jgi:hypothetical protein
MSDSGNMVAGMAFLERTFGLAIRGCGPTGIIGQMANEVWSTVLIALLVLRALLRVQLLIL